MKTIFPVSGALGFGGFGCLLLDPDQTAGVETHELDGFGVAQVLSSFADPQALRWKA